MKLIDLCNQLELPKEVVEQVMSCSTRIGEGAPEELLVGLTNKIHAKESYEKLIAYTNPENLGMDMLTYMLYAALKTYDKYIEKNISEKVYIDTMKCFTRFINEHHASFGYYGFDRGWWTHRQLSMVLFRIGELEYEFIDDQKCVSLHIPSGANIALEACQKSFKAYQDFVHTFYPEKENYQVILDSWLLSPALKELLEEDSKIIQFRNCFEVTSWEDYENEFLQWVYGRCDIPLAELPEQTQLQRKMKAYLLEGGKVGGAKGHLIKF